VHKHKETRFGGCLIKKLQRRVSPEDLSYTPWFKSIFVKESSILEV